MSPSPLQPQISLDVDLLRPVLSMPPVILRDGGSCLNAPRLNVYSIPASPIVDFPPSPAPSQQPVVEFPEDDVYEYDEDGFVVEVRKNLFLVSLARDLKLLKITNLSIPANTTSI
jgi:hypothetical protein